MKHEDYLVLQSKFKSKTSSNTIALLITGLLLLGFLGALVLASSLSGVLWVLSQVLIGIMVLQWFFLLHDLGHGHYFRWKVLNVIFGHIASLIVILPLFPWRFIHRSHHLWTGWKDKDPTMSIIIPREVPEWKKGVVNFCWKYWIPIFTLSFSFSNFWNVRKLFRMFPEKKFQNLFSIVFPVLFHGMLISYFGWGNYVSTWGLGYLFFLLLSDPLLLSQHSSIPQQHTRGEPVTMVPFREQDRYTRSLNFPRWARVFLFLGFDGHILHHLFPTLPGYRLVTIDHESQNNIHWYTWLREAKKTKGFDLILSEELNIQSDKGESYGTH